MRLDWPELRRGITSGRLLLLLLALAANGCAVADIFTVSEVEARLPGLSADDLRLCAGLPERTAKGVGGQEFWSYERSKDATTGTVSFAGFGINFAGDRECRATFELSEGRVRRVAFTRATSPSACAPLVQTCVGMVRSRQLAPTQATEPTPAPAPAP